MTAPSQILDLIQRFDRNRDAYLSAKYNETQLRQEFINPFFETLGWDMTNKAGYAEAYKDVIHEDAIKIGGATKAPDYCFRIGGSRKFFLEAKKPSVNIKEDVSPAFQLRRYAYSAKLPLSILSDFEELAVYDCRLKPVKTDKASAARTMYIKYSEYPDRWEEISSKFSRDAVLKGSFDKYVESTRAKKGAAEVDDALLTEIEHWRDILAHNIAIRNTKLSQRELNFAVQRTIDRIVFLRICEDRGVELYGRLQALLNGANIYKRLVELFRQADEKYNSGLFHFLQEKNRSEEPDKLTLNLGIDDKVLKDIVGNLYYPDSPYEFSVMPADILGQVYEQFLGKVIRLTEGHRAVVEDKPEVKKAGGVYYTPKYIVDYIVKNTVGSLVGADPSVRPSSGAHTGAPLRDAPKRKPMTPKDVAKLKILDPACGSGSFLIGAYQYLLDWHRDYYVGALLAAPLQDGARDKSAGAQQAAPLRPDKNAPIYQAAGGEWRLTTAERKRILLNNIFGVDIDPQAVEVTKLSLLLKVLEGESEDTIANQRRFFHQQALPDLGNNIKCGNSLIGPEFYDNQQMSLLDEEEKYRINVLDWKTEFPIIIKNGGFDAVIGNPPYGALLSSAIKKYLTEIYNFVSDFESSQYFLVKSKLLVKKGGLCSFIVPNTLFLNIYARKFRNFVSTSFLIDSIANLSGIDVFEGATVRTAIPVLVKSTGKKSKIKLVTCEGAITFKETNYIAQDTLIKDDSEWTKIFSSSFKGLHLGNIRIKTIPLGEITEISQGLIPYDKYRGHDEYTIKNRIWHSDKKKDKTYKKELRGGDIKRYNVSWNGKQWISYGPWLAAPRKPKYFIEPRLLFREITDPKTGLLYVAYTDKEYYNNPGIINCISREKQYDLFYILGIANSRLIGTLHFSSSPKARKGVFPKILVNDVRNLPICSINFSDPADKSRHDRMVELVERMLELNKRIGDAKTEHENTALRREIEATDSQIDRLVYELYGLTEDEIKIVEGENNG